MSGILYANVTTSVKQASVCPVQAPLSKPSQFRPTMHLFWSERGDNDNSAPSESRTFYELGGAGFITIRYLSDELALL